MKVNVSFRIGCALLLVTSTSFADTIHEAAEAGDINLVKKLLAEGANVDAPDLDGTPLQWALLEDKIEVAKLLLEHGADPNVKGWDGTLLESAVLNENIELINLLLKHGADPNTGEPSMPLIRAVQKGNTELVDLLVAKGADPSRPTGDGKTALHEAAQRGKLEIANKLVEHGAEVNALDELGRPPIHYAAANDHNDLVEYLRQKGAKPGNISPITELLASADLAKGKKAAEKEFCADCHIVEKDGPPRIQAARGTGPTLVGVVGRSKASVNDFKYSSAFSKLDGEWTYEALNRFLARTTEVVPGTMMNYRGISDPETRANLILYLRSLSDNPVALP